VLDGLLYNESELEIEEHYTDTQNYTETQLCCLRHARPAVLSVHPRRSAPAPLASSESTAIAPTAQSAPLVSRADWTIDTDLIAELWDRMDQLYTSLKKSHVTASVALKRLVAFGAKNRFYRANRDLRLGAGISSLVSFQRRISPALSVAGHSRARLESVAVPSEIYGTSSAKPEYPE
jgi:TnpA family transposase